jgi:hypothetical protein
MTWYESANVWVVLDLGRVRFAGTQPNTSKRSKSQEEGRKESDSGSHNYPDRDKTRKR